MRLTPDASSISPILSKRGAILVFRRAPAAPIERALFCRRSSQVASVERPPTAPALRLINNRRLARLQPINLLRLFLDVNG